MTTNYHTALVATDDVDAENVNLIFDQLGQQLSDMDDGTHAFSAIDVDGGEINAVFGGTTPGAGTVTDLTVNNDLDVGSSLMVTLLQEQSFSTTTVTIVRWNKVLLDTDSAYDLTTYRWTPTVAGHYAVVASMTVDVIAAAKAPNLYVYKNGVNSNQRAHVTKGTFNESISTAFTVNMNGTTDYLDIRFQGNGTGTNLAQTDELKCYFGGRKIY